MILFSDPATKNIEAHGTEYPSSVQVQVISCGDSGTCAGTLRLPDGRLLFVGFIEDVDQAELEQSQNELADRIGAGDTILKESYLAYGLDKALTALVTG